MNILEILNPEIQKYIIEKTEEDISKLAFQKNPFPTIDFKIILNQIEGRKKSVYKLKTWFDTKNIIYSNKISIEQTSSEITANYKSEIVSGNCLIDLSGGFGVDSYYFSKKVNHVIHCEINSELSEIVAHNYKVLECKTIKCIAGDSSDILRNLNQKFDWIYLDPSRRNDVKGKVFMLKDSAPNVPKLQEFYFQFTDKILIKTAPLLDITAGLNELKNVKKIHVIAIQNEVKELLWEIEKEFQDEVSITTVNFNKIGVELFQFNLNSENYATFGLPANFLYEPNNAIMKSGGFAELVKQYQVVKLHQNTHLFTSEELFNFPGRVFKIEKIINYSKKEIVENLTNKKANITTRNFPETVENIRKKWKIKDGGTLYCFFTTDINHNKIILLCTKIN
jgi:hypothetical protein